MQVILNSEPIEDLRSATSDSLRLQRFAWIDTIRAYADAIGLEGARTNYTRLFDTGPDAVSYNVSASPVTRLEPFLFHFPFVGPLPYKGYFTRDLAVAEAERLRAKGYDTIWRPVSAYSTLGYLPDPLLSTMLEDSEDRLADLLLHELTHATIFAKGHIDYNESVATFVGRQGSLTLMSKRHGEESPQVLSIDERLRQSTQFTTFMTCFLNELDSLYALNLDHQTLLGERDDLLRLAQDRYRADPLFGSRYDGFLSWKQVNNAQLLSYRRYNRDLHLFEQVYQSTGRDLGASVRVFSRCSGSPHPFNCLQSTRI